MPTTKTKQFELQGALTLAEIDVLRAEIADLKLENAKLTVDNESLKRQLHDLTDPGKMADAAAFKASRRR